MVLHHIDFAYYYIQNESASSSKFDLRPNEAHIFYENTLHRLYFIQSIPLFQGIISFFNFTDTYIEIIKFVQCSFAGYERILRVYSNEDNSEGIRTEVYSYERMQLLRKMFPCPFCKHLLAQVKSTIYVHEVIL